MSDWILIVDRAADAEALRLPGGPAPKAVKTRDYLAGPPVPAGRGRAPRLLNLSRSYAYLGTGYYASLLAEARGHRVLPTVQAILELRGRGLYKHLLPGLEDELNRRIGRLSEPPTESFRLFIAFGYTDDPRFPAFARRVFDRLRVPLLELRIRHGEWRTIVGIKAVGIDSLDGDRRAVAAQALAMFTRRRLRPPKATVPARWTLAVLTNPKEALPPSSARAIRRMTRVAAEMGVAVEPIEKKDLLRLAEYDGLFIRETTAIDTHTFRFARRAEQEGMPVIDDPTSILRCTNKVYLTELMAAHGVPTPATEIVDRVKGIERLGDRLGWPVVLKIPDGSFSRGVVKAANPAELRARARDLLAESDLILAQEYMYTDYDWRVGVLDGEPLYVCQYLMAKKHWQIVRHDAAGRAEEGGFRTLPVEEAPPAVIDAAVRAARPIGRGLYGVDLKQSDRGVFVIEVNDNPNLDADVEDAVLKDELWRRLVDWFVRRLEGPARP